MPFFMPDGSHASVTGDDLGIVRECENLFSDVADQIFVIAAFEIGSAYAFVKNDVSRNQ